MTTALIMAGGRSTRMRATAGPTHKAMLPVLGVPMLERNICALLRHKFDDIVVATNVDEPAIEEYLVCRGQHLAAAGGSKLRVLREASPLGTIGVAREVATGQQDLLVVNVDNLTALDLRQFVNEHHARRAAMSIATHVATFRVPFGEVEQQSGKITNYFEKPAREIRISSGTYVLSPAACAAIPAGQTMNVPDLFRILRAEGATIYGFEHQAAWIDVNDASCVRLAENMLLDHASDFECWNSQPRHTRVDLLLRSSTTVMAVKPSLRNEIAWDLPSTELESVTNGNAKAGALDLLRRLGFVDCTAVFLIAFDDYDESTDTVRRHYVFSSQVDAAHYSHSAPEDSEWIRVDSTLPDRSMTSALRRGMAVCRRMS